MEGRVVKDAGRKPLGERQNVLTNLVDAVREYRSLADQPLTVNTARLRLKDAGTFWFLPRPPGHVGVGPPGRHGRLSLPCVRGISAAKSEQVGRTRIPTTSLLTSCSALAFV